MITRFSHFLNESEGLGLDAYTPEELGKMLHRECRSYIQNLEAVEQLINAGAFLDTQSTPLGFSSLHAAAQNGHLEITYALIDAGAALDLGDNSNRTALGYAAINGHLATTRAIIDAGANLDSQDNSGCTALHNAASVGYSLIAQALLDAGANPNIQDAMGSTALHMAARENNRYAIKVLLNAGASKDIKDNEGNTPWDVAPPGTKEALPELQP